MKLIVGLGNPGAEYQGTRHNLGFLVLDFLLARSDLSWGVRTQRGAIAGHSGDIMFIKPQEFYNLSGKAVAEYQRYYKIKHSDILVICDDFNLEFGKIRLRKQGSAGGNNGLKSVMEELKTEEIARLRIGTGNDELRQQMGDVAFVLAKFTPEEREKLPKILVEACEKIQEFMIE